MPSIPKFPVRDFKFEEIAKCALADWGIPTPKHPQLESVLTSYGANTSRVRHLMLLPTSIVGAATVTQRIYDLAEYEMTGRLTGDQQSLPADVQAKIQELGQQMLDSHNAELEKQ